MKNRLSLVAVAVLALASTGALAANDTAILAVTARVAPMCQLSLTGPMNFGVLDPTLTQVQQTVTASYRCTKGTAAGNFTVESLTSGPYNGVLSPPTGSGIAETIAYAITWDVPLAFTGEGLAGGRAERSVLLTGTILQAAFLDATPAVYRQNVHIAINY